MTYKTVVDIDMMPSLQPIRRVYERLKGLVDRWPHLPAEAKPRFWIAGGAITAAITGQRINDFDVFSNDPELLTIILTQQIGKPSFEIDAFANFYLKGDKIQVIKRYRDQTPIESIQKFDYTIVCAAYDGKNFYHHERFFEDIATRRLVINVLPFPLKTMERMTKYAQRGYAVCPIGLMTLAQTINQMKIDWNNPDENQLFFYPDGSLRFAGVD